MSNPPGASVAPTTPDGEWTLDCAAIVAKLWELLDEELGAERAEAVRGHIGRCAACRRRYDFERRFLLALATQRRRVDTPPALRDRVISELRAAGFALR